jgi:hypothetical protein
MSFEEFEDAFIWSCDSCGLRAELPATSFWAAWGDLKGRGWRATRLDDGWTHACGKCSRKSSASILDMPARKVSR